MIIFRKSHLISIIKPEENYTNEIRNRGSPSLKNRKSILTMLFFLLFLNAYIKKQYLNLSLQK